MKGRRLKKVSIAIGHTLTGILIMSLLLSSIPLSAKAQTETGQITVKATDPQSAVVAGATVKVKSVDTGREINTVTNDEGIATVTNLQPGLYEVTVEGGGFAPFTQRVQVTVGAKLSVEASLSAQAKSEVVNVIAGEGGVTVNTQSQELSNVVSAKQVAELPTLTRNPYDLVAISGNVSVDPNIDPDDERGVGVSLNGQRAASVNILLDGGENVDAFRASVGQSVPLDAVQEFRVITSNFSAEYGRASGGIVNVATKAGSNDFHGTLFEFNRVSALASNGFDNNANRVPKGVFTRNQFGYSLGGRVIRDKLFFFSSTEWTRVRSSDGIINVVPTPEFLARTNANTRAFFNAFPLATPINGQVFTVGEIVDTLGGFAAGSPFASLPRNLPAFGQVIYSVPTDAGGGNPQNSYSTVNRVDWNISDKTQLYGRYALESQNFFPGTVSFSPYQGFNTGQEVFNNNFLVSLTHSFSPSIVSQTKLVYNRLRNVQPLGDQPVGPILYLTGGNFTKLQGFDVAFPGYLPFTPGNGIPFGGPQNLGQLYQDVNYTRGTHQFRFGGQFVYIQDNRAFGAYQEATEILGGPRQQGLDNLVRGQILQFQGAVNPQGKFPGEVLQLPVGPPQFSRSNRYKDWALYFNDSWRLNPSLTLNLGLRYEYYGVQRNKDEKLDSNFYFGEGANTFERIRNGRVLLAPDSPAGGLWKPDKNNFAPRLGFAWDVTRDGKTSLRGGYGIAYERNFGNVTFNVIQNPPNYAVVSLIAGTDVASLPITLDNSGPLAGTSGSKLLPRTSLRHVREDIVAAYTHFYSFALERELSRNTVASIEYTGSTGRKLYSIENLNRSGTGLQYLGSTATHPTLGASNRLNPQFSNINTRGNGGKSRYNAMIASVESSALRDLGLQLTARYTLAVARDNLSTTFSEGQITSFGLGLLDPFDPGLDYGYADFDVRHRFAGSINWQIPVYRDMKGVTGQILGGWQLTGIFIARTGNPFSIFDCSNAITVCPRLVPTGAIGSTQGDSRPDPSTPNRFNYIDLSNQTPGNFINPITNNAEVAPFPANMTRRNAFRAPGFWNLDAGIYKNFRITETKTLQFRSEFYNAFNHANLYLSAADADVSAGSFVPVKRGITGGLVKERRNIQLALKFIF